MTLSGTPLSGLVLLGNLLVATGCAPRPPVHPTMDEEFARLIEPADPCPVLKIMVAVVGTKTPATLALPGLPPIGSPFQSLRDDPRFAGFAPTPEVSYLPDEPLRIDTEAPMFALERPGAECGDEDCLRFVVIDSRDSTLAAALLTRPVSPADSLAALLGEMDRGLARVWLTEQGTSGRTVGLLISTDYEAREQILLIFDLGRAAEYLNHSDPEFCVFEIDLSGMRLDWTFGF